MNSITQYVDAAAELLNLPIDPEYRPGVIANLELIAEIARLVTEFPLAEEVEPAPVFHPFEGNNEGRG
jgi:hypothetical protein